MHWTYPPYVVRIKGDPIFAGPSDRKAEYLGAVKPSPVDHRKDGYLHVDVWGEIAADGHVVRLCGKNKYSTTSEPFEAGMPAMSGVRKIDLPRLAEEKLDNIHASTMFVEALAVLVNAWEEEEKASFAKDETMAEESKVETLDQWELLRAILDAQSPRVLLHGRPGIGKSYTPAAWARQRGWEFFSITLTDQTPMSELRGHYILKANDFVWHDGIVARAWRASQSGTNVLLEFNEINEAGQDTETFLHNALDDPAFARLDLPNGETLMPRDGAIINLATMNGDPDALRPALLDRFPVRIGLNTPHPNAFARLGDTAVRRLAENLCAEEGVSIRAFVELQRLMGQVPTLTALQAVFGATRAKDLAAAMCLMEGR